MNNEHTTRQLAACLCVKFYFYSWTTCDSQVSTQRLLLFSLPNSISLEPRNWRGGCFRKGIMEVEFFSNYGVSEEDTLEVAAPVDNLCAEGERCGICMDVVIDRGVLDCCEHWFCFACIDNWATITNFCPLCQNEIQQITCVPVFDTDGSGKTDEGSDFRDDDCCVEGKNNTLSFPSYYIDENAVTCLDEGGCKLRNGSVPYEETLTLDTSIACDSCDIWYHAVCVGFDPESTGVDSWFCPRCLANKTDQKSDLKEMYSTGTNANPRHRVDTTTLYCPNFKAVFVCKCYCQTSSQS